MTGDFNCIPDSRLDKWGGDATVADKGIMQLHAFVGPLSLKDVFCMKIMSWKLFTRFNGLHLVGCCLDHFYTLSMQSSQVRDCACDPFSSSDHHMVSIKLHLWHSNSRGWGVWKFNMQLLKSEDFCS